MTKKELLKYFKSKKSEKKKLEKECMSLWAEIVKLKSKNKCEFFNCCNTENLNAHHIFSKGRFGNVKFDIDNGMCLCPSHHTLGKEAAHKDINFKDKILGKYQGYRPIRDEKWFMLLERKANCPQKIDLNLELLYLKKELNNLLNN